MTHYGIWMDIPVPEENQTVPHTPEVNDPYFPMILVPQNREFFEEESMEEDEEDPTKEE